jgi:hypothetical protein
MVSYPGFIDLDDLPIGFSSLIGCSFLILEEAVNPESAKDSVRHHPSHTAGESLERQTATSEVLQVIRPALRSGGCRRRRFPFS